MRNHLELDLAVPGLETNAAATLAEESLCKQMVYLQLLLGAARVADTAKSVEDNLRMTIAHVCRTLRWPVGHAYAVAEGSPPALVSTGIWHFDHPAGHDTFKALTESISLHAGEELPGWAWKNGKAHWVSNIAAHPSDTRTLSAWVAGLRSGFAIPVFMENDVAVVLEFYSDKTLADDDRLLEIMTAVGAQLSHSLELREAEKKLELFEDRVDEIVAERTLDLEYAVRELMAQAANPAPFIRRPAQAASQEIPEPALIAVSNFSKNSNKLFI